MTTNCSTSPVNGATSLASAMGSAGWVDVVPRPILGREELQRADTDKLVMFLKVSCRGFLQQHDLHPFLCRGLRYDSL